MRLCVLHLHPPVLIVVHLLRLNKLFPWLHFHYRNFVATTEQSAPASGPRYAGSCRASAWTSPLTSRSRFLRSVKKPLYKSCYLCTGCHPDRKQVPSGFIPGLTEKTRFWHRLNSFRCFINSSLAVISCIVTWRFISPFGVSLTTLSLKQSSIHWFATLSCKTVTRGLPSSLSQLQTLPPAMFSQHTLSPVTNEFYGRNRRIPDQLIISTRLNDKV